MVIISCTLFVPVYAQTEEKTFASPKFGLSMKYPSDWTFVEEEGEFTPGIYDYSVMIPPGTVTIGRSCPTISLPDTPKSTDCETEPPVYLQLSAYKLKDGTTLKEFYDGENSKLNGPLKSLIGTKKNIETNKINISGLSAVQKISTQDASKGSLGKLLESIGSKPPVSKDITVYVTNGSYGYQIFADVKDETDFDRYYPVLQKMINSIQINGAKENPENTAFVPENVVSPTDDVVLLSHKLKKGDGEYNDIIGQVKNVGSDVVDSVKIGVTFYNKNRDIIGTDSTYAEATTLKPNQKSTFDILSKKHNFVGMASYELSLYWQDSAGTDQYVENAQIYNVKETKK